jgi:hypothetical protein|tara:strand:+ start:490 stop:819 length:330 start_codon:yes stop_codon:yes gene_type:complete
MANTFKNKVFNGSNTTANSDMTVYTVPSSTTTVVIGLTLSNTSSSQITVDIKLNAGQVVFLAKDIPIPAASSFEYMGGNKIVMETGHSLILQSDTANSLDTVASIMEIT